MAKRASGAAAEELVRCRVTPPGGVYLREGPGRAYREICIMAQGAEVLCEDRRDLLRGASLPLASAWVQATFAGELGWVDAAFLEQC